jgi:hypothetical protein
MRKLLFLVIFLCLDLIIEGRPQRETKQLGKELIRPIIDSVEERRCQENFQTTMLDQTNKYRSLKSSKPLQESKKLQYVALLAAKRCHVLGEEKTVESIGLFNTGWSGGINRNTSSTECKQNAVILASDLYDLGYWNPLDKNKNYSYMGCAISIVDSTACQGCYYKDDKGADKLELDIVPSDVNLDLESYNDSFWTHFPGK